MPRTSRFSGSLENLLVRVLSYNPKKDTDKEDRAKEPLGLPCPWHPCDRLVILRTASKMVRGRSEASTVTRPGIRSRAGAALSRAGRTQCAPTPGVFLSDALIPRASSTRPAEAGHLDNRGIVSILPRGDLVVRGSFAHTPGVTDLQGEWHQDLVDWNIAMKSTTAGHFTRIIMVGFPLERCGL